jgi:uncharacterized damage-inducible protein DinB
MNTISLLYDLFRHMHWADALMWRSVLEAPAAMKDRTTRERLHHIHLCQHAWLLIWKGQDVDPQAGASLDLYSLGRWAREYHESVLQYVAGVQEPELERIIKVPEIGKQMQRPALGETFIQITTHSAYHRGQVSTRLREIGGEISQTDFIRWVCLGKPRAEWPSESEMKD